MTAYLLPLLLVADIHIPVETAAAAGRTFETTFDVSIPVQTDMAQSEWFIFEMDQPLVFDPAVSRSITTAWIDVENANPGFTPVLFGPTSDLTTTGLGPEAWQFERWSRLGNRWFNQVSHTGVHSPISELTFGGLLTNGLLEPIGDEVTSVGFHVEAFGGRISSVPEPGACILVGVIGSLALAVRKWRRG